jgi:hypothetical protein
VAIGFEEGEAILLGELTDDGFRLDEGPGCARRGKRPAREKLTDRDTFWNLIAELMVHTRGDLNAFEQALDAELAGRAPAEIRAFAGELAALLQETCTWDVYGAATIIGCNSEDSFLDFRRWIVFQGPRQFVRIIGDPDCLGTFDPASNPIEQWYSEYHPTWVYQRRFPVEAIPTLRISSSRSGSLICGNACGGSVITRGRSITAS